MEERVTMGWLLATYRRCLPEKQARTLSLFFEDDFSLAEIAETENVSRQAVHETIRRGEEELLRLESGLHLMAKEKSFDALRRKRMPMYPMGSPSLNCDFVRYWSYWRI
ncbi:MAG: sigma factor-like helix-turn-helix DNA-binding protein [Christensenellales bacterium]|jgi:predicted DNA-binding protein YlxM (UPF0122 family)